MPSWRPARSLLQLRDQINLVAPNRSKAADGLVGDLAHSKSKSEHNPDKNGVVRALDITNDPARGCHANSIVAQLIASKDPRILYIIWDHKIIAGNAGPAPWAWRSYTGKNPHSHHFHLSVVASPALYDSEEPWKVTPGPAPHVGKPEEDKPILRKGSHGDWVRKLQEKLNVSVDGAFGPKTERALKEFQESKGLVADGVAGFYTFKALGL